MENVIMDIRPICPACSNHTFKIAGANVTGSRIEWDVIRCAECGAAITFFPRIQTNALIRDLAAKLGVRL